MTTPEARTLILNSVIPLTLESITVISIKTSEGEIFRKIPTDIEIVNSQKTHYTFYLTENEGNGSITGVSLYGDGATVTLGTGTEMTTQTVNIVKDNTQSLTIDWTVEVKNVENPLITVAQVNSAIDAKVATIAKGDKGDTGDVEDISFTTVEAITNTYTLDLTSQLNFAIETGDTVAKTIVFSNVPSTAGLLLSMSVKVKYTNAAAISYPASVTWLNSLIPTYTAGKSTVLMFLSYDNGTTWLGSWVGAW